MESFSRLLERAAFHIPYSHDWLAERDALRNQNRALKQDLERLRAELKFTAERLAEVSDALWVPPGHFYSPIPAVRDLEMHTERVFGVPSAIPDVDFNEKRQLELLDQFRQWYADQPFEPKKTSGRRYYFENENYSYADAIILYCMMRHLKPQRIVEVGSGYSSCAILDVNALFFDNRIDCAFVDPYPALLHELLEGSDHTTARVFAQPVQDVDIRIFEALGAGDILFIDSSHVAKTGSDVNHLFFIILPVLKDGVHIHFHDIFCPFEYPRGWALEGRAWNEAYLLRAFLAYNRAFQIRFFTTYLVNRHRDRFEAEFPLFLKNTGGSLWLQKTKTGHPSIERD